MKVTKIKETLPDGFGYRRVGGKFCIFKEGWEEEIGQLAEKGLKKGTGGSGEIEYLRGRGRPAVVPFERGKLVVRHYYHGGLFRWLTRDLFRGVKRPLNELCVLDAARRAGINVPEAVGLLITPTGPLFIRADLITVFIPDSIDLLAYYRAFMFPADLIARKKKRDIIAAAGREVAHLHRAGIVHGDLQVKNIMIKKTSEAPRVFILDLDQARQKAIDGDQSRRNLLRLYRSFRKMRHSIPDISQYDPIRFLRAYAPGEKRFQRSIIHEVRRLRWRDTLQVMRWKLSLHLGGSLYAGSMGKSGEMKDK